MLRNIRRRRCVRIIRLVNPTTIWCTESVCRARVRLAAIIYTYGMRAYSHSNDPVRRARNCGRTVEMASNSIRRRIRCFRSFWRRLLLGERSNRGYIEE